VKFYTQQDFTYTEFFTKITKTQGLTGLFAGTVAEILKKSALIVLPTLTDSRAFYTPGIALVIFLLDTVATFTMISYPLKPPGFFIATTKLVSSLGSMNAVVSLATGFVCTYISLNAYKFVAVTFYDKVKSKTSSKLITGFIVYNISGCVLYPIDTISRYVVLMNNMNVVQVINYIYRRNGIWGFYSGYSKNLLKFCIGMLALPACDIAAGWLVNYFRTIKKE